MNGTDEQPIDLTALADFLHEADTCTLAEVVARFGSGAPLRAALGGFIKAGEVEVLSTAQLQWWGTSTPPTQTALAAQRSALQHGAGSLGMEDPPSQPLRDAQLLLDILTEVMGLSGG